MASGIKILGFIGVGGVMASSLAFVVFSGKDVPTVGLVEPLFAAAPEVVELRSLSQNQTLGDLLLDVLDNNAHNSFVLAFRERADPRRLRAGTEVAFRWFAASPTDLRAVDVAIDADRTVRLTPSPGGWDTQVFTTPVVTDTVWASGDIESDLWSAVLPNDDLERVTPGDRAKLILDLNDIFKWQIDMYLEIRPGDFYRFSVEREVRPDGTMRVGQVLSAELVNQNRPYKAVWFDPNGDGDGTYYDEDGNSVRRSFLTSPISLGARVVSSGFSISRFHPILRTWRAHRGVDYAMPTGTPIEATGDGRVIERATQSTYGNTIVIRHPNGWTTRYAHMNRFATGTSVGSRVDQGEVIGYVGMTGLATGPHVHYEMRINGTHVDPRAIELPPGDPVPIDQWELWESQSRPRMALLDRLPLPWDIRLAVNVRAEADAPTAGAR